MKNHNSRRREYLPQYTYDDYCNWEGKWELIGGIAYAMTPLPSIAHQRVSGNIHTQLHELLKGCGRCKPLLPVDWKIAEDTVVQPDNMVVCGEVSGNYLTTSPVMIFEILSPATTVKDKNLKYEIYQSQGVKYYIIVDVAEKIAEVYGLDDEQHYTSHGAVKTEVMPFQLEECRIEFDFGTIW
ncbi:MAG: Uma2 family endonuclease [Nitrospirota bacterium]|nr:Uma2 family endonuclease [Nitrospirota bacterium]